MALSALVRFRAGGLLGFNVIALQRQAEGNWTQHQMSSRLWPQRQAELVAALAEAGFVQVESYGDLQGTPFDAASSGNLVLTARKG